MLGTLLDRINMEVLFLRYVTGYPWSNPMLHVLADSLNPYLLTRTVIESKISHRVATIKEKLVNLYHGLTESMIEEGFYKPLAELLEEYGYRYPESFDKNYGWEIMSFTYWLVEKKGLPRYLRLLRMLKQKPSLEAFTEVYGESLEELERELLAWLRAGYGGASYPSLAAALAKADVVVYDPEFSGQEELLSYIKGLARYSKMLLYGGINASAASLRTMSLEQVEGSTQQEKMLHLLACHESVVVITTPGSSTYEAVKSLLRGEMSLQVLNASADVVIVALSLKETNRNVVLVAYRDPVRNHEEIVEALHALYGCIPPYSLDPSLQGIMACNGTVRAGLWRVDAMKIPLGSRAAPLCSYRCLRLALKQLLVHE